MYSAKHGIRKIEIEYLRYGKIWLGFSLAWATAVVQNI